MPLLQDGEKFGCKISLKGLLPLRNSPLPDSCTRFHSLLATSHPLFFNQQPVLHHAFSVYGLTALHYAIEIIDSALVL